MTNFNSNSTSQLIVSFLMSTYYMLQYTNAIKLERCTTVGGDLTSGFYEVVKFVDNMWLNVC